MTIEITKTDGSVPEVYPSKTVEINKTGGGPGGEAPVFTLDLEQISIVLNDDIAKVKING